MAAGVCAIASPVEVNKEIINDGFNGFLARNDSEWVEKISLLIENADARKKIGLSGRKTIEKKYSLAIASDKLLKILNTIVLGKK